MADDTDDGVEDERTIELSAIEAIYPELSLDASNRFSAHIDVPVELQRPLPICFPIAAEGTPPPDLFQPTGALGSNIESDGSNDLTTARDPTQDVYHLSYLPPLNLKLLLPDGYPARSPPHFEIRSSWLPGTRVRELEKEGTDIWNELGREQVVFAYIDFLWEAAEDAFGILSGNRTALEISADLKAFLLDFDLKAKRAKFDRETFECGICLEPKKGTVCHRLKLCSHVFCVECLQDFYNSCIIEGDVGNVKCIAPKCGDEPHLPPSKPALSPSMNIRKKDRTLGPNELLQIPLEQETVQRYIKLKRKKRLESDRTTIYCPRQWCQGPARSKISSSSYHDSDSDIENDEEGRNSPEPQIYDPNEPDKLPPPSERLAICEDCGFAFCKVCKVSWHGEYYACFPRSRFELTVEERASEDYMKLHTQPCPTCDARAQKTYGCNHMICFKCDTHFCYLCGAYLDKDNPYQHYNSKGRGCYMRLWELEAGDGAAVGQGFEGGFGDVMDDVNNDDFDAVEEDALPPPAPAPPVLANPLPPPIPIRRQQGQRNGAAQDAALQRFLQLIHADEEDEWDSDEMEDDLLGFG